MLTGDTGTITNNHLIKALSLPFHQVIFLLQKGKWIHTSKIALEFKGTCLKQNKSTFTHRNVVNLFIAYRLDE